MADRPRELAARYPEDREAYIAAKTSFVHEVLPLPVVCP